MNDVLTISVRRPTIGLWIDPSAFDSRADLADEVGRVVGRVASIKIGEVGRDALGLDLRPGIETERVGALWTYDPDLDGPTSKGHFPAGPWVFDRAVTDVFDDMLRRSIPQIDVMRSAVVEAASRCVRRDKALVLDVGCSRGNQLAALLRARPSWEALALDRSVPMIDAARASLAEFGSRVKVDLRDVIDDPLPDGPFDVVLLVLVAQFISPSSRAELILRLRRRARPGGCIVLVEKVDAGAEFVEAYHALKVKNGYSADEVEKKAESLKGVLVPLTAKANEAMLSGAGWHNPECFWRWFNFAAWIARA